MPPIATTDTTQPTATQHIDIDKIIDIMASNDAVSDLHIAADDYISYRVNGEIVKQTQFG